MNDDNLPDWVKRLIQIRHAASLSVEEMADRLGISPERLQALESGRVSRPQRILLERAEQVAFEAKPTKERERILAHARKTIQSWMNALYCEDVKTLDRALGARGTIVRWWNGGYIPKPIEEIIWQKQVEVISSLMDRAIMHTLPGKGQKPPQNIQ